MVAAKPRGLFASLLCLRRPVATKIARTHQLAESDREHSDFQGDALDRYRGNILTTTGPGACGASDGFRLSSFGGIMVKNETTVRPSTVKPP